MKESKQLAEFIQQYPRLFILSGAGVSTGSGIPAYRDKEGNWQHSAPVQHQKFMREHYARQRYWARSLLGWPLIRDAEPGDAHRSLAQLESMGHVGQLVTQNVDRLHQKAGSERVVDLHGRSDIVRCMACDAQYDRRMVHEYTEQINPQFELQDVEARPDGDAYLETAEFEVFNVPECEQCGGILKPDVVFFGDNVPKEKVFSALDQLEQSDALLTVGSSLMVYSGFRFCKRAKEWDKPICALNLGKTRADDLLSLKLDSAIEDTLKGTVNGLMGSVI